LSESNAIASNLSNLSLQLYSILLKTGYVKDEEESQRVTQYFNERLPKYEFPNLGFREKLWLYKAHLWYSFIMQDFLNCFKYATKWVDLFYEQDQMIKLNPVFFLKGNNYLLEALFFLKQKEKFQLTLENLENTIAAKTFPKNDNLKALSFLYVNLNKVSLHAIDGSFKEGLHLIPKIEKDLLTFKDRIDEHHEMVFYYKFASIHFGSGNYQEAISYLDKIIHNKSLIMREDLLCFSRILSLIAHYEAGKDEHLDADLISVYKFLIKMNDLHEVQKELIKFIRGLQDIYPHDLKNAFKKLLEKLKTYEHHPYERRPFLYLDLISWLESKISNTSVDQIIRNKYLKGLEA
jgi:tetratricopeptide (TPR) repeat protein